MKNADMPATAITIKPNQQAEALQAQGFGFPESPTVYKGLTKREHFAGLVMQGLLAGKYPLSSGAIIESAVEFTDALLKALEE